MILYCFWFFSFSFFFFCPGRWDGTLCDCALTFFFFFLVSTFFFYEPIWKPIHWLSERALRSVYFHLQNRKWWSNKNKRWNEKSVVSLFLLSVQASPWTFLKEEKFIGDSFYSKKKKKKKKKKKRKIAIPTSPAMDITIKCIHTHRSRCFSISRLLLRFFLTITR